MSNEMRDYIDGLNNLRSVALEEHILASAMIYPSALEEMSRSTTREMFTERAWQFVADELYKCASKGFTPEITLIRDSIPANVQDTQLSKLYTSASSAKIVDACQKLNKIYMARGLVESCQKIISMSKSVDSVSDFIDDAQGILGDLPTMRTKGKLKRLSEYGKDALNEWQQSTSREGVGIKCGLPFIDSATNGFRAGEMIVVAGRPGQGKTSLALSMGKNAALNGKNVGFYSMEMRGVEVYNKVLSMMSSKYDVEIPYQVLRGTIDATKEQFNQYGAIARDIKNLPFYINDSSQTSMFDLEAELRAFKRKHNLDLMIIDYLSLIKCTSNKQRWEKVGDHSMAIKSLLRDLGIPGIILQQLSRDSQNREPTLADLRDSGQVEQDADMVYMLHRDDPDNVSEVMIIAAKGRNVARGKCYTEFSPRTTEISGVPIDKTREVEEYADYEPF